MVPEFADQDKKHYIFIISTNMGLLTFLTLADVYSVGQRPRYHVTVPVG